ncbi:hypothetical protein M9H77_04479 [Catharanthus roseus]|uniref:Uncharacterized protein n=1 Tax=Catharanthus roseus TaxID=4058 RepID=A0ACC0CEA7_CATRO|nr:hypothetical protein M9H77_04479 [Catharanthus roseus]
MEKCDTKKLKVRANELLTLHAGLRVVEFDDLNATISEAQGLLAGFCGNLASDSSSFPISFEKWLNMPNSYFDAFLKDIIKPRFVFNTTESIARRYISQLIGNTPLAGFCSKFYLFFAVLGCEAYFLAPVGVVISIIGCWVAGRLPRMNEMMDALRSYLIKKEGEIPAEFAPILAIFVSLSLQPNDARSKKNVSPTALPAGARGSSASSAPNHVGNA